MAKLNEGDVIEGIFTISLGLFIADGKIDKQKLNKIRTQVDPQMFRSGRVNYVIAKNLLKQRGSRPPDFFNVEIEIRLKAESTSSAFGEEYQVLYSSSNDVGNINKKIDQLIKQFETSNFTRKINGAIDYFLNNNFGEIVNFKIVADGIAGESSGGEIKGDVSLEVYATRKGSTKRIIEGSLPFSLKSESVTVASLSPYHGMLNIAKAMGIQWDADQRYIRLSKPFIGAAEQKIKFEMIVSLYEELKQKIQDKSKSSSTFTKDALMFLEKSIFGSDLADVIDVTSSGVKEITKEYYDVLKNTVKLKVEAKGNNLVFVDIKTNSPIFQIRTKLRPPPANEAKFYLEVGKGIYSK
jgi:hypothetical protein